jgi:hypothetical protein
MEDIKKNIIQLQIKLKELRTMNITEPFDLEMAVLNCMPEFYDNYPSIVKRLCKEEIQDNTYLYKMLELLQDVEKGDKSLASVEYNLGEELAQKFVYPLVKKEDELKNK